MTPDEQYQAQLKAMRGGADGIQHPLDVKGPTTFSLGTDGKLRYHTRPVPEWRMKRARRILWECRQNPKWARTHAAYYKHPSLKNVPYPVLKQLVKESED
ncbi:hypothetical protein [Mycobacterium paraintracellulare]